MSLRRMKGGIIGGGDGGAVSFPHGLIDFGLSNQTKHYTAPQNAALNLPTGAWCWGMWTRVDQNAGNSFQYLLSSGTPGNTPSFALYLGEALCTITAERNRFVARIIDDAGVNSGNLISSVVTGADAVERLVVIQSTGATLEMWLCAKNGTASQVVDAAVNLGALTAPTIWYFGARSDLELTRFWEEKTGGWSKGNAALSKANIEAIASGSNPATVLGGNARAFWTFFGKTIGSNETDTVNSIVATYTTSTQSIEFVQKSNVYIASSNLTSHTLSYTAATTGADRKLIACISLDTEVDLVTGVTYDGVAMTRSHTAFASGRRAYIYHLNHASIPTDGVAHDLVVTLSSAEAIISGIVEYRNVAQTAPSHTGQHSIGGGGLATVTLASVSAGALVLACASCNGNETYTPGAGQTEHFDSNGAIGLLSLGVSDKLNVPAGDVTMTMQPTGSGTSMAVVAWEKAA